MKTITLKEAYNILEQSSAVIINEYALVYPAFWELNGDVENEFLYLSWEEDGDDYCLKFCEGDNPSVKIEGCRLFLFDTDANDDDDLTELTILTPKQLE